MNSKTLDIKDRKTWRRWLEENHKSAKEIWLIYYKKHTKKPTIAYNDAVEEAICFGWIDGKVKSIDSERYMQRYTPRNPNSIWSLSNKKRAQKMIKKGLMTRAGLAKVKACKKTGKWQAAYSARTKPQIPEDLKKALENNPKAWENFEKLTNSQQFQYIYWILNAKRKEAREKRIWEVVRRCEINKKPGVV